MDRVTDVLSLLGVVGEDELNPLPKLAKPAAPIPAVAPMLVDAVNAPPKVEKPLISSGVMRDVMLASESKATDDKKKGRFSTREKEILDEEINKYCRAKGLDRAKFLAEGCSSNEHAWKAVASCLPHRSARSVYDLARRYFRQRNVGKWSPEDENKLRELVKERGERWSTIGSILNRTGVQCRDKWRDLRVPERRRGHFEDDEKAKLIDIIAQLTDNKLDTKNLPWTRIASMMGTRSYSQCRLAWAHLNPASPNIAAWTDKDSRVLIKNVAEQYDNFVKSDVFPIRENDLEWTSMQIGNWTGPQLKKKWAVLTKGANNRDDLGKLLKELETLYDKTA